jgi:hypothetical protein
MGTERYQTIQHSDYPTTPILTKVLSYFLLLLLILGCTNNHRRIHFVNLLGGLGSPGSSHPLSVWEGGGGNILSYYSDVEGPGRLHS